MILLIDNYDSFAYNLYQMVGVLDPEITVVRNDAISVEEALGLHPDGIILSPGPGRPVDAGVCEALVRAAWDKVPLLGVCLGHQAICEAFGAPVSYARQLMHGKASPVMLDRACPLFYGLESPQMVARYHSLAIAQKDLPDCLAPTALADDGEVMAVAHKDRPVFGLQFHPESIMTPAGPHILEQFVAITRRKHD